MSTKKKHTALTQPKDKGPQPLVKLKFEKFPEKPVAVYFETTKLCFYADFGFEQYESPSVAGLKQKILAAIKRGATPSPVWAPMIELSIDIGHGRTNYKHALDLDFDVNIERNYFCIGQGGKLMYCGWEVHERSRNKDAHKTSGTLATMKPRALNAPICKRESSSFDGGSGVKALIPYTDALWKDLGEHIRELRAQAAGLIGHVVAGKVDVFTNFIFDFERHAKAETAPRKKPVAKKKADTHHPMLNSTTELCICEPKRRTDQIRTNPYCKFPHAGSKKPFFPLHDGATPIATGTLGKGVLPHADFAMLDLVIDLPAGHVPIEMLQAAGFPGGTTAKKEGPDFWVSLPGTGALKFVPRAEMQKLIRDRINGQRGAKPQKATAKAEFRKVREAHGRKVVNLALGKSLAEIRDDVKHGSSAPGARTASIRGAASTGVRTKPAAKKKSNGDHTAREHLVVKYQGKQLTLGHGPLGNYLVEALRKTYPEIHSAWGLKDNRVQLHIRGEAEPRTIQGVDFERLINHPEPPSPPVSVPELNRQFGQGAISKLHELVNAMEPEDPPVQIPSVILVAAGFTETAIAEIHSPDEIIVRDRKKAPPQFLTLHGLEERILAQTAAAPEKDLVPA